MATEAEMFVAARGQSFFCINSIVWRLKVEKVVKPPQKPVMMNRARAFFVDRNPRNRLRGR